MHHFHSASILAAITTVVASLGFAHASVRVGAAEDVVQTVVGAMPGENSVLKNRGDDIFDRESIWTELKSSARLLFSDRTQVLLGPRSGIKIDRTVYNPGGSAHSLIISVSEGVTRWTSGDSPPEAYQIGTPFLSISPTGTTFDLVLEQERNILLLREGRVRVCSVPGPQRCAILNPGEMIVGTARGLERQRQSGSQLGAADFANQCLSASSLGCKLNLSSVNEPPRTRETRRRDTETRRTKTRETHRSERRQAERTDRGETRETRRTETPPPMEEPPQVPGPSVSRSGCYQERGRQVCCIYRGGRRLCRVESRTSPPPSCTYVGGRQVCCTYYGGRRVCRKSGTAPTFLPRAGRAPAFRAFRPY